MPKTGDLILVHLVDERPIGTQFERTRNAWPLHITIAPWFMADEHVATQCLTTVAASITPFAVQVGERQLFGGDHDIPVNVIRPQDQQSLKHLHKAFVAALRGAAASFVSEQWMGDRYRAHITKHDVPGGERHEGDGEQIDAVHLVRLLDNNICEVVRRIPLGGSNA
jgi:2'-5' RNA ligase